MMDFRNWWPWVVVVVGTGVATIAGIGRSVVNSFPSLVLIMVIATQAARREIH